MLLLMSEVGVTDMVPEEEIRKILTSWSWFLAHGSRRICGRFRTNRWWPAFNRP